MSSAPKKFWIPVFNGVFAHRKRIGAGIWVFLWLIDHTTREMPATDGKVEGLVHGGNPIPLNQIAADLDMSWRSIYDQLCELEKGGYIRKVIHGNGLANGYAVLNSKRFVNRRGKQDESQNKTPEETSIGTPEEKRRGSPLEVCMGTPEEIRNDPCSFPQEPLKKSATHNRKDNTRQHKDDTDVDPSLAARFLCEVCGNFDMRFQRDRSEQIRVEAKNRGLSPKAIADLMISQWNLYNDSRAKLNCPVQSAERFWSSGTWHDAILWPWRDGHLPKPQTDRRYASGVSA